MKNPNILFIGTTFFDDFKQQIDYMINNLDLKTNVSEFVSSYYSRIMTELIENYSFFSSDYDASFLYNYYEEKAQLRSKLESGVSYVALTTRYFRNINEYKEIVDDIRSYNKETKIIIGGGFITSACNKLEKRERLHMLQYIHADYYILKYQCNPAIKQILENKTYEDIELIYREDDRYYTNTDSELKLDIIDNPIYWNQCKLYIKPVTSLKTTVSCPYNCSFCAVKNKTDKFQHRSLGCIKKDLDALKEINKTEIIHFIDETINAPLTKFKTLLKLMIDNEYGFKWFSFFRTELINDEIASMMKDSGCIAVLLGMESGNDAILDRMGKGVNTKALLNAHGILKKYGISTIGFYIAGFPGETDQTIQDTIDFINCAAPTFYRIHVWECDTNTKIWHDRDQYNLTLKNGVWRHVTMSSEIAKLKVQEMNYKIYNSCSIDKLDISYIIQLLKDGMSVSKVYKICNLLKDSQSS